MLGLAALLAYGASLHNGLVYWDDTYLLARNPIVRSFTPLTIWHAFSAYDPELYIPLTFISYQLTYLLAGASTIAVHGVNLLLHAANAYLVFLLLRRWCGRPTVAAVCAMLFLLHPLHTEAVAWASGRKDVLSTFFFLVSMRSTFRSWDRNVFPGRGVAFFLLALLSKVTVFTLPVLLLLERWRTRSLNRKTVTELLPFFALSVFFGIVAIAGKTHIASTLTTSQTILLVFRSTALSIQHAVVPFGLSPIYEVRDAITLASPATMLSIGIMVVFIAAGLATMRKTRDIAFGILFFLIAYAPSFTTFSKAGSIMLTSDRYAYVPSIGLLFLLALGLRFLLGQRSSRQYTLAVCGCALIAAGVAAAQQAMVWRDTESLFKRVLLLQPESTFAPTNLGVFYGKQQRFSEAEELLRRSIAMRESPIALIALGNLLEAQGKLQEALTLYERASAADVRDSAGAFALGDALARNGRKQEAMEAFRLAIERNDQYTPALQNLAALLLEQGALEEAERLFVRVLEINPYYSDAHFNYAILLQATGRTEESADAFIASLRAQPSLTIALESAVPALRRRGKDDEAVALLLAAVEDDPENADNGALALATAKEILAREPERSDVKALVERMFALGILQKKTEPKP